MRQSRDEFTSNGYSISLKVRLKMLGHVYTKTIEHSCDPTNPDEAAFFVSELLQVLWKAYMTSPERILELAKNRIETQVVQGRIDQAMSELDES